VIRLLATVGPVGHLPGGPVLASLLALPAGYLLHRAGGFPLFAAATLLAFALGFRAARDPGPARGSIVIDEVVGQWIALGPLSLGLWLAGAPPQLFPWPGWVSAFLLFQLLDAWKPGPVGWADRREGPAGVMLGDAVAGLIAALVVTLMAGVAHGWLA
jgi:phosphatidylglycerophosphatase A